MSATSARPARRGWPLWVILGGFVAAICVIMARAHSQTAAGELCWLLLSLTSLAAGVVVLARCGLPKPRQIIIAVLLALLVYIAYLPYGLIGFNQLASPALALVAVCACCSAHDRFPTTMPGFWRRLSPGGVALSLGLALSVGLLLGVVNLALSHDPRDLGLTWQRLVLPLSPAIVEEVADRAVLLALGLVLLGGRARSGLQRLGLWLLMTVPHLLAHAPQMLGTAPVEVVVSLAVLFVLFALPFAVLQRARDLTTAMVAHGLVDLMRFVVYGLPV